MTLSHADGPSLSDLTVLWLNEKLDRQYAVTTGKTHAGRTRLCIDGALVGYIDDEKCEFRRFYLKSPEDVPISAMDPECFEKIWNYIETIYAKAARVAYDR